MREHLIEISTEVFRLLQERASAYVAWTDEKPGPTQRILLGEDAYTDLIDRAIEERKTIDTIITELCARN